MVIARPLIIISTLPDKENVIVQTVTYVIGSNYIICEYTFPLIF